VASMQARLRVCNKTLFYGVPPESAVNPAVAQPGKELQSLGFTMHITVTVRKLP
jgi:hypothetical protein